jgi:hypothetical protein
LDVLALDYIIKKKWIEGGTKLRRIYTTALAWTVTSLLLTNALEIVTSDRGEEVEYERFFICISEFMKLVSIYQMKISSPSLGEYPY